MTRFHVRQTNRSKMFKLVNQNIIFAITLHQRKDNQSLDEIVTPDTMIKIFMHN